MNRILIATDDLLGCGTGSRWESSSQRPKEHASQSYTQFLELSWPG
jgi:hypothetical protein